MSLLSSGLPHHTRSPSSSSAVVGVRWTHGLCTYSSRLYSNENLCMLTNPSIYVISNTDTDFLFGSSSFCGYTQPQPQQLPEKHHKLIKTSSSLYRSKTRRINKHQHLQPHYLLFILLLILIWFHHHRLNSIKNTSSCNNNYQPSHNVTRQQTHRTIDCSRKSAVVIIPRVNINHQRTCGQTKWWFTIIIIMANCIRNWIIGHCDCRNDWPTYNTHPTCSNPR